MRIPYDFVDAVRNVKRTDSLIIYSSDVESQYTNVPIEETIEPILNNILLALK